MSRTMTLQAMAQAALDVQTACNLSGVAVTFGQVMLGLRALPECEGTEWANRHPIALLFADKIAELTGCYTGWQTITRAYDTCTKLAAGETV